MFIKTKKWLIAIMAILMLVVFAGCNSTVKPAEITIQGSNEVVVGEMASYTVKVNPAEASKDVTFESNNSEVLEITESGIATAKKEGNVVITAKSKVAEVEATLNIRVVKLIIAVDTIEVYGVDSLTVGDTTTLGVDITPENATDKTVSWTSSNPEVATVDNEGVVTTLKPGVATITATSNFDNNLTSQIIIEVFEEGSPQDICLRARDYVLNNLPRYIDGDFTLPKYDNSNVEIVYQLAGNKTPFKAEEDGSVKFVFPKNVDADQKRILTFTISYVDGQTTASLEPAEAVLRLCLDAEDNDFVRLDEAISKIDELFTKYTKEDGEEVATNLEFPQSVETSLGKVALSWSSDVNTTIGSDGTYIRPNDNTRVIISTVFTVYEMKEGEGGELVFDETKILNSEGAKYKVVAHGYTKEEKIEFLKQNELAPYFGEAEFSCMGHTRFPSGDARFGTTFTWVSPDQTMMSNEGKLLKTDFDTIQKLTYKVKVKYDVKMNEFEEELDVFVNIKPFTTTADAAAFSLSNNEGEQFTKYFPWGRVEGNILTLPSTIAEYPEATIAWSCEDKLQRQSQTYRSTSKPQEDTYEEDLIWTIAGNEATLNVQPLRYTESKLIATVSLGGNTSVYEHIINVGIAEKANTNYVGMQRSYSASTKNPTQGLDFLSQLSPWDLPYQAQTGWAYGEIMQYYTMGNGYSGTGQGAEGHAWSGYTYYWDDPVSGRRQQFFASAPHFMEFIGAYAKDEVAEFNADKSVVAEGFAKVGTKQDTGNFGYFMWNNSEVEVKVPTAYVNVSSSSYNNKGVPASRENFISIDSYRYGAIYDKDGNVVFGCCEYTDYKVKEDGTFDLDESGNPQMNYKLDESGNPIPLLDGEGNVVKDEKGEVVYETIKGIRNYTTLEGYLVAHQAEWVVYQLDENTRVYRTFDNKYQKLVKTDGVYVESGELYEGDVTALPFAFDKNEQEEDVQVYKYPAYYVIPAGGYALAIKTQNNTEQTNYIGFCTIGNKMTFEKFALNPASKKVAAAE